MTMKENKEKRYKILYDMNYDLAPGIHTRNPCDCGRDKRGSVPKCVCCLADDLRKLEKEMNYF